MAKERVTFKATVVRFDLEQKRIVLRKENGEPYYVSMHRKYPTLNKDDRVTVAVGPDGYADLIRDD